MGDARRRMLAKRGLEEIRIPISPSMGKVQPFQELCPNCRTDLTGRCMVARSADGAVLFILAPMKCPGCGRVLVARKERSPVLRPSEVRVLERSHG